ncbi:MAG: bifunctional enoyl-CoA hydratase/phosphate acetyltransferase [Pseudomonadota bacterium]
MYTAHKPSSTGKKSVLENVTFDELSVGHTASLTRTLSQRDIELFAAMSGDINPTHMDEAYAKNSAFHGVIGHGMWSVSLISTVLGTLLPGPGTIYLGQNVTFKKPVRLGETVTVTVTVLEKKTGEKKPAKPIVVFDCSCTNSRGEIVAEGKATVLAPTEKVRLPWPETPDVILHTHTNSRNIIEACRDLKPIRTAVVHPVTVTTLEAAMNATQDRLILPILIGPRARILKAADEGGLSLSGLDIIDVEHSAAAAAKAVDLAAHGRVDAIMKGSLHTDELMAAIVPSAAGLRTARHITHSYLMEVPAYHKPIIITDAAINIMPDLATKADICQNAIDLWRVLFGMDKKPKVAILAAVETVNSKMQGTLDAAALCKMADRGQITDCIMDGPLAFDTTISKHSAKDKGIFSTVAGDTDILVVPEIEAGNILSKQLIFLGHADAAGIVLGARVPIILTSRADDLRTRLLSCALAVLMVEARRTGAIK